MNQYSVFKGILRNTAALAAARVVERSSTVVLSFVVARRLGAAGLGVYSATMVFFGGTVGGSTGRSITVGSALRWSIGIPPLPFYRPGRFPLEEFRRLLRAVMDRSLQPFCITSPSATLTRPAWNAASGSHQGPGAGYRPPAARREGTGRAERPGERRAGRGWEGGDIAQRC